MDKERIKAMVESYLEDYNIYYASEEKKEEIAETVASKVEVVEVDRTIYFYIVELILTLLIIAIVTNSILFSLLG